MDKTERIEPNTVKTLHEEALATALAGTGDNVCPRCRNSYDRARLTPPEYKCACGLELAYVDVSPSGEVKGVLGWLHSPGAIINDRYRVVQMLGRGGFGSTYLVEDMKLGGKRRALKEVPDAMYDEHEIRILSKLNHPSVPDITDRASGDGMVYIVLEFGGSRTLESVRRSYPEKRVPLSQLAPWVRQLCDVLAYIHAQTPPIVHRDLKPGNILLDDADRIMLIDFGIAKEAVASEQTRAMGRAVTHGYSPPEQAMGTGTDARSDVYALGATVLFMLTGQRPPGAAERIQGATIPEPSKIVPGIPPAIDRALLQSLALNPNERQQDVREFGKAFDYDTPTIKTYGDAPDRTMVIGEAPMSGVDRTSASMPSIKLSPEGARVIKQEPAAPVARGGGSIARVAIIGSIVGLLIAAAVVAWIGSKFGTPAPAEAAATPAPAVTPAPLPPPAEIAPVPVTPPAPAETTAAIAPAAIPPINPAMPAPPPVTTPPAAVATPEPLPTPAPALIETPAAPVAPPPEPAPAVVNTAPAPAPVVPPPAAVTPPPEMPAPAAAVAEPEPVVTEPPPAAEEPPPVVAKQEPVKKPVAKKKKKPPANVPPPEMEMEPEPAVEADSGNAANAWQKANEGATFIEGN